jgi:5-methylcytosine-specific restriction protein A
MNRLCPCGSIAEKGRRCSACTRRSDSRRGSSGSRGYGSAWRRGLRKRQLRREPRCEYTDPEGQRCSRWATDADHIVPKADGGRDELDNLQSLCHAHHSMKTAREVNARRAGRPR